MEESSKKGPSHGDLQYKSYPAILELIDAIEQRELKKQLAEFDELIPTSGATFEELTTRMLLGELSMDDYLVTLRGSQLIQ